MVKPSQTPATKLEYVITTLAEYQTVFWIGICRQLQALGHSVSLISFDDNSTEMLRAAGFKVYGLAKQDWQRQPTNLDIEERFKTLGVDDTAYWYTHEKANFAQWNDAVLDHRLYLYLDLCQAALADVKARGHQPVVIQELGGFLSVIAAFHAARHLEVDNWFVEPTFFKGRSFWLKNTFGAMRPSTMGLPSEPEALTYLEAAVRDRAIVIPIKDRHQYTSPATKVVNARNFFRIITKLHDKYIRKKRQEFSHVWSHIGRHVSMIISSAQLKRVYNDGHSLGRFIYYPLHVPGDMALTLRSPTYLDQVGLVDIIARQVPRGYRLAIKEHPAMIGAISAAPLRQLLARRRNVVLVSPRTNNYDLIARCEVLVSVNSKSGAEAVLLGKPVVVLGDAFYRDRGLTIDVSGAGAVGAAFRTALAAPGPKNDALLNDFFSAIWRESAPGELYVVNDRNIELFSEALVNAAGA